MKNIISDLSSHLSNSGQDPHPNSFCRSRMVAPATYVTNLFFKWGIWPDEALGWSDYNQILHFLLNQLPVLLCCLELNISTIFTQTNPHTFQTQDRTLTPNSFCRSRMVAPATYVTNLFFKWDAWPNEALGWSNSNQILHFLLNQSPVLLCCLELDNSTIFTRTNPHTYCAQDRTLTKILKGRMFHLCQDANLAYKYFRFFLEVRRSCVKNQSVKDCFSAKEYIYFILRWKWYFLLVFQQKPAI